MIIINETLSYIFAIEAFIKIIALGFYFNGKNSYLKNGWNKIDFFVVVNWVATFNETFASYTKTVKVIRIVRIFRPLRLLKTAKGLQLGI